MPLTPEEQKVIDDKKVADDAAAKAAAEKAANSHTFKQDGRDVTMTTEELITAASKAGGADAKFEQASQMLKDAAEGSKILAAKKALDESDGTDETLIANFVGALGLNMGDLEEKAGDMGNKNKNKDDTQPPKKITLNDLDPHLKEILSTSENMGVTETREKIENSVRNTLDKDAILCKMVGSLSTEEQSKVKEVLFDMAIKDVKGRILTNEAYGTEMINSVVQQVRANVEKLGIPSQAGKSPPMVGPSPLGNFGPEIYATEPIKRVSSTDPKYIETAVKRAQQQLVKFAQSKG